MGWILLDDTEPPMYTGDEPWDLRDDFMDSLVELYQKKFNRKPYREELEEILDFSLEPYAQPRWRQLGFKSNDN